MRHLRTSAVLQSRGLAHSGAEMVFTWLQAVGLGDGDHLTAIEAATGGAFALFCSRGGRKVTWDDPDAGGDSSGV